MFKKSHLYKKIWSHTIFVESEYEGSIREIFGHSTLRVGFSSTETNKILVARACDRYDISFPQIILCTFLCTIHALIVISIDIRVLNIAERRESNKLSCASSCRFLGIWRKKTSKSAHEIFPC